VEGRSATRSLIRRRDYNEAVEVTPKLEEASVVARRWW
jgi:hypothetical protein